MGSCANFGVRRTWELRSDGVAISDRWCRHEPKPSVGSTSDGSVHPLKPLLRCVFAGKTVISFEEWCDTRNFIWIRRSFMRTKAADTDFQASWRDPDRYGE